MYKELRDKTPYDLLNEQLFSIGMTFTGCTWEDLNNLVDRDRLWLIERCKRYQEELEELRRKNSKGM